MNSATVGGSAFLPPAFLLLIFMSLGLANVSITRAQDASDAKASPDSAASATSSNDPSANVPEQTVSVDEVIDDSKIQKRLIQIYEASGWFTEIDVKVNSGIVVLGGFIDTEKHSNWASAVASRTEGVIAVVNKASVRSDVDFSSSAKVVQQSLDRLWRDFMVRTPLLLAGLVILLFTSLIAKLTVWSLGHTFEHRSMRASLKDLIYQLSSIGIWVLGLLIATVVMFPGMTPSKALTVLGLGSVAIGFAFKDIFENFFAGILILWRYPFDRGDFVTCGDLTGRVQQITVRNTLIRRLDGELAIVPNGYLFKNNVDVLTNQPQRRVRIICGVAYDEDVKQAREVIREAVQKCDSVVGKRTVEVFANEFADSSINFEVAWWTGSKPIDVRISRDEVIESIKSALDEAGIEIPFPYRTLTFKNAGDSERINRASGPTS